MIILSANGHLYQINKSLSVCERTKKQKRDKSKPVAKSMGMKVTIIFI